MWRVAAALVCVLWMAGTAQAAFVDDLDGKLAGAAKELFDGLPKSWGRTVWVIPFEDGCGGVTTIGQLAARKFENHIIRLPNVEPVDRDRLDIVMKEKDLGSWNEMRQAAADPAFQKMSPASLMVTGRITAVGEALNFDLQLVRIGFAQKVAAASFSLPRKELPADALAYVQRPTNDECGRLPLPPMELKFNVTAQRRSGGDVEESVIRSGDAMRSGDQFQVRLEPASDCYVYLLLYGSDGQAARLFPNKSPQFDIRMSNLCHGGISYVVPDGGRWFSLDDNPGTERLYVVASYEPLPDVDGLLDEMEKATGKDGLKISGDLKRTVRKLGEDDAAGRTGSGSMKLVEPAEAAGDPDGVGDTLRGRFAVVKEFVTRHER